MSKKSLANMIEGFGDDELDVNTEDSLVTNTEPDSEEDIEAMVIRRVREELLKREAEKAAKAKSTRKQVSIYLDADVLKAYNEHGKQVGKGAKSNIINELLAEAFGLPERNKW